MTREINSELPDFVKIPSSSSRSSEPVKQQQGRDLTGRLSEKLEEQESADVSENEILSKESLKLYEEQRAKEEAREVKLRYLNSFTGYSYPNYSYRQKVE